MKKLFTVSLVIILLFSLAPTVYAAEAIESVLAFNASPAAANINQSENYYLDVISLGIFDTDTRMINALCNVFFGIEKWIVRMTCVAFYHATSVNIADTIQLHTGRVQKSLKDSVFDALVPLAFSFVGLFIAWLFLKKNFQEIFSQLLKFVLIIVSASLLVSNSPGMIRTVDSLTSAVSSAVMSAMSSQEDTGNYGVTTVGALWQVLIHEPWLTLEFGSYDYKNDSDLKVEEFLADAHKPKSADRQKEIDKIAGDKDNPKAFGKEMPLSRLPLILMYFGPMLIKCLIYLAIAVLQLAFRVMTILLFFIGIPVLLLALVPQLGGTQLIWKWLHKIVEMQLMIIMLSFTLAFITLIDNILHNNISSWGWLITILIQTGVSVVIFIFRDKILDFFKTVQGVVRNPAPVAEAVSQKAAQVSSYINTQANKHISGTGNVFGAAYNWNRDVTRSSVEHMKGQDVTGSGWRWRHPETAIVPTAPTPSEPAYKNTSTMQRPSIAAATMQLQAAAPAASSTAVMAAAPGGTLEASPKTEKQSRPRIADNSPEPTTATSTQTEAVKLAPLTPDAARVVGAEHQEVDKPSTQRPKIAALEGNITPEHQRAIAEQKNDWPKLQYYKQSSSSAGASAQAHHTTIANAAATSAAIPRTESDTAARPSLNIPAESGAPVEPKQPKPRPSTTPEKGRKTQAQTDRQTSTEQRGKSQNEAASHTPGLNLSGGQTRAKNRESGKQIERPSIKNIDIIKEN